jgi:3-hydroxyisobutyrate dehydrogenase-like beta-hydroxyacid dehydrogenase
MCLSDYAATSSTLAEVGATEGLNGRVVVQLASGTSKEARALEAWANARGASYLDGAISAWPSQIGGPDAAILVAGQEPVFTSVKALLQLLAGGLTHVGPNVGHAKALFGAALAYHAGHWISFSHGAAICEAEGLDTRQFGEMMASLSPAFADDMRHMADVIADGDFGSPQSTIKAVGADIARLIEVSRDLGIGTAFPTFAADIFERAVLAGYGGEEHSAVTKVLRSPDSGSGELSHAISLPTS